MHQESRRLPRIGATGVLLSTLLALVLLLGTACGGDDAAATAEPPFTLPTNLPSPEAVIDDTHRQRGHRRHIVELLART